MTVEEFIERWAALAKNEDSWVGERAGAQFHESCVAEAKEHFVDPVDRIRAMAGVLGIVVALVRQG